MPRSWRTPTVTNFVLDAATARARKVIRANQDLVASDRFPAELDWPACVLPELARLFRANPKLAEE